MKKHILLPLAVLGLMASHINPAHAQPPKILRGLSVAVGMGTSTPDRRLQDHIQNYGLELRERIKDKSRHSNDDWQYAWIEKRLPLKGRLYVNPALGYLRHSTDFPHPINFYHFGRNIDLLSLSGRYTTHNLMAAVSPEVVVSKRKLGLSAGVQCMALVLVRKNQFSYIQLVTPNPDSKKPIHSKAGPAMNSLAVNPYLKLHYKGLYLMGSVRAFHLKWRDGAIWNTGASTDDYNPLALFLTLGFEPFGR